MPYSYLPVHLPTLAGDQSFTVHGIHAELGFGLTSLPKGCVRHLERAEGVELALPIGVLIDPSNPSGKAAFSAGIVTRFLFPL